MTSASSANDLVSSTAMMRISSAVGKLIGRSASAIVGRAVDPRCARPRGLSAVPFGACCRGACGCAMSAADRAGIRNGGASSESHPSANAVKTSRPARCLRRLTGRWNRPGRGAALVARKTSKAGPDHHALGGTPSKSGTALTRSGASANIHRTMLRGSLRRPSGIIRSSSRRRAAISRRPRSVDANWVCNAAAIREASSNSKGPSWQASRPITAPITLHV